MQSISEGNIAALLHALLLTCFMCLERRPQRRAQLQALETDDTEQEEFEDI